MDKDLQAYLAQCDVDNDAGVAMVGAAVHGPGYHSCLPSGIRAHGTRDALQYALALLQAGGADRAARAAAIVDRLLSLQDRDPFSPTYGIWSWFLEEPLDRMSPPDWNWADFCGALLAQMLVHHAGQLTEARRAAMRAALGHAVWSIFRRNVNAVMAGAGVRVETLAGGSFALAAGRRRAIVHTAPGCFGAQAIRWEAGQAEGRAYVDAVCHSGGPAGFNLAKMTPVLLASAVELAGPEQTGPAAGSVEVTAGAAPGSYSVSWSGLNLDLPGPSDTYPV